jgi:type II secretory ATPase GspE/PulE/Tfp pilus assembly ATPase PilB-like protein
MGEILISSKAQAALVKLLIKSDLLWTSSPIQPYSSHELFPIAFYATLGHYREERALEVLAERLALPLAQVSAHVDEINALLEMPALQRISAAGWLALRAIPFQLLGNELQVGFANPLDQEAQRSLEFELNLKVVPAIARESEIVQLLGVRIGKKNAPSLNELLRDTSHGVEASANPSPVAANESNVIDGDVDAPTVVRLVNKIFADAIAQRASDVHISPEKESLEVRIRIDGIMRSLISCSRALQPQVLSRIKLLGGMDISERRRPQDGRLRVNTPHGPRDLRLSTVPTVNGENIVIRILVPDSKRLSLEELGMPAALAASLRNALSGTSRVILVTGPTGSGKTSTLYACLGFLNDATRNIITIEDPIEYRVAGAQQIQVNSKIGLSFAEGLRSILRQDPDVIMVGEIRDRETAEIAMQAAQTGHLVLSTLHTNSAAGAIVRLEDLGLARFVLASSLGAVVAQRLVRTLCTKCAVPASEETRAEAMAKGILCMDHLRQEQGCDLCGSTGFHGRVGLYSLIHVDDALREAIRNGADEAQLDAIARKSGTISLQSAGLAIIEQGLTTLHEVERVLGIIVPAGTDQRPSEGTSGTLAGEMLTSSSLRKPKLLLVEDDDNTREVLSLVLKREMYDVVEACDGVDALEKLYEQVPDIIVADLMMPRMGGIELLKKLQGNPNTQKIPVLILTAVSSEENELSLLDSGAQDFVSKTANTKILLSRIQKLLPG